MLATSEQRFRRWCRRTVSFLLMLVLILILPVVAMSQQPGSNAVPPDTTAEFAPPQPTLWNLAVQGGIFMIPIAMASVVVVAFFIERLIGLRKNKIMPPDFLSDLKKLSSREKGLDPRDAYHLCQRHKSPLARVVRLAVLKVGRPHAEVEKAVEDAVAREAADMSHNIRPINVLASISPLLGLLGTVQGMIMAFMVTSTTSSTGAAKGQELAQGIYTALVTTFAGLSVAILAVLFAHHLEGRIDRLLREMEDFFLDLIPQFERFEGKLRITRTEKVKKESGKSSTKASSAKASETHREEQSPPRPPAKNEEAASDSDVADEMETFDEYEEIEESESKLAESTTSDGASKGLWDVMHAPEDSES